MILQNIFYAGLFYYLFIIPGDQIEDGNIAKFFITEDMGYVK